MAFWKKKYNFEPEQNPEGENPGGTGKKDGNNNMRETKKSLHRWKLLVVSLTGFIAFLGLIYGVITFTSTPTFCATCHEMAPEHVTFQKSAHNQIKCTQCHIKPGIGNLLIHKVESLKEVYSHIVGPPDPIVQTVAVLEENCKKCHTKNRLISATGDLIVNHKGHIEEGIPCITCHSGVVHAKVVERGINDSSTYDAWTMKNSDKLMGEQYEKPNMGTCIDCHDQVNEGKQPWKDISYSLPEKVQEKKTKEVGVGFKATAEMEAGVLERDIPENTQKIILQAIGQQKDNVKISMECFTCHQKINTPKNHDLEAWDQRHGDLALKGLDRCLKCHQDSKWIKRVEKQDIKTLLKVSKEKVVYKQDLSTVTAISRTNHFCRTCHINRPDDHLDRYTWLTDTHRNDSGTKEQRQNCYVCHDLKKPDEKTKDVSAPSDVYCEFCHKNGFVDEPL
ncbi:cytochrome c3 family protein [Bacillus sp. 1NLA3E]|uniref:cytochrome c3 family protein n=1 Tax=Bacillus sp. 1NLA3E TaxID=666686 RepID=UPI000247ECE1|nr:NapC/NirT family cytochrome c [Bacillus sp. 1NLA3E]AGK55690.1 NapC/NirT cytochrome c domain protein [Bacillus sp. 1NLA3E]